MGRLSTKDPESDEWFNWDCTKIIESGAGGTIASILEGPFEEEGDGAVVMTVAGAISQDGLSISAKLKGGTDLVDYAWTVRFLTTMGETLDHTIRFMCADKNT